MNRRVYFELRRSGHGDTNYAGVEGEPERHLGVVVDVCEGGTVDLVARESTEPTDIRAPRQCTAGTLQSRLVEHPVPGAEEVFQIHVVDRETGRGVPMVGIHTHGAVHYTDSAGLLAYYDASTMYRGRRSCESKKIAPTTLVFESPGYETRTLFRRVCHGGSVTVALKRLDVAQRLYRFTGAGIYRDSVILGWGDPVNSDGSIPIREPLLDSDVAGADFASATVFDGKIFWSFGDTKCIRRSPGVYRGVGATSELDALDPDLGLDLDYFTEADGDSVRPLVPTWAGHPGLAWLVGLAVAEGDKGELLYASIAFVRPGVGALGRFSGRHFLPERELSAAPIGPSGTAFRIRHDGSEFLYRRNLIRHPATRAALLEPSAYEVFTPLCQPALDPLCGPNGVEHDVDGVAVYRWRAGGSPVTSEHVDAGLVRSGEVIFGRLRDIAVAGVLWTGESQGGQGSYNEFRDRFVRIVPAAVVEDDGVSLAIYYAEADTPMGPWVYARRVATVPQTMYAVSRLPFFDREDGRIYFVGTHSNSFGFPALDPEPIPRYDYNQLMYALDLDEPQMFLPVPVYDLSTADLPARLVTRKEMRRQDTDLAAAFFAHDRPAEGALAVSRDPVGRRLILGDDPAHPPLFYVLPATDRDQDGIADAQDSCLEVANPAGAEHRDPDRDGYGVECDGDYDNDGAVDRRDLKIFRRHYGQDSSDLGFDSNLDHDRNGSIAKRDWAIFRRLRGAPPGPSGLACAGTTPCLPDLEDLVPLHEFVNERGEYAYSVKDAIPGHVRTSHDLGLVWRNPIEVAFPVTKYMMVEGRR